MSHPLGIKADDRENHPAATISSTLHETQFFEPNAAANESSYLTFNGGPAKEAPRTAPMSRDRDSNATSRAANERGGGARAPSRNLETFLETAVSDPVKQGDGLNAYVTYKVSTRTNMPIYCQQSVEVIRRFSDFEALHDRLAEENKGAVVPPLPEKNVVEKYRLSAEFIEARRRALEIFLRRVARHDKLRFSTHLKDFLETSEEHWARQSGRLSESSTSTLLKKAPTDFFQMFKGVQASLSSVVMGKEKAEEEVDAPYLELKQYVADLEGHLAEAQRQSYRLVKRQKRLGEALSEFGEAVVLLGQCEGGSLGLAFTELGDQCDALSSRSAAHASDLLMKFEEPLKEYVRMAHSIKNVMLDREQTYRHQLECVADLEVKNLKKQKLDALHPQVRLDKLQEAERDVADAQRRLEVAKEQYTNIIERFGEEVERFQEERTRDFAHVFRDFAKMQAKLSQDTAELWRSLLPHVIAAKPAQLDAH